VEADFRIFPMLNQMSGFAFCPVSAEIASFEEHVRRPSNQRAPVSVPSPLPPDFALYLPGTARYALIRSHWGVAKR
jgi:hypothetical protein